MSCFSQEIVLDLDIHKDSKVRMKKDFLYVKGIKNTVETVNSKRPNVRKTGLSLQTPKKHKAPRGFLLGSLEAPRPITKYVILIE